MKKIITLLFILASSVGMIYASDIEIDGIWYELNNTDLTAAVTYKGNKYDSEDNEYTGHVEIPEVIMYKKQNIYTVTSIKYEAFRGCTGLTKITIPKTILSIESHAFYGCTGLTSITIPKSIQSIGLDVFKGCSSLTSIIWNAVHCADNTSGSYPADGAPFYGVAYQISSFTISEGVEYLPAFLCYNMINLQTIVIPSSIREVHADAFYYCNGVTSVVWNAKNCTKAIGFTQTQRNNITSFTFGSQVESLPEKVCYGLKCLKEVIIPSTITTIGTDAFYSVPAIRYEGTATGAPWGAQYINAVTDSVFLYNDDAKTQIQLCLDKALTEVTIPTNITSIHKKAFTDCNKITSVNWNAIYCSGFADTRDHPFYSIRKQITSFTFGNEVEIIPQYCCYEMINLDEVFIPESVMSIGMLAFSSVPIIRYTGYAAGAPWGAVKYINGYIENDLRYTDSTKTVLIKCENSNIESANIPSTVKTIRKEAFYFCDRLASITIPSSVTSIGDNVFMACTSLQSCTWNSANCTCGDGIFNYSGLISIEFGDSVKIIPDYLCAQVQNLKNVTIGKNVTSIGKAAFSLCNALEIAEIPASVTSIGDYAFQCDSLKCLVSHALTPPECNNLGTHHIIIFVPQESVDTYKNANGWKQVECIYPYENKITIDGDCGNNLKWSYNVLTRILSITGSGDMYNYPYYPRAPWRNFRWIMQSVNLPEGITSIGDYSFDYQQYVKSISIPKGVTYIGKYAFEDNSGLEVIDIPSSVTQIAQYAFRNCTNLVTFKCRVKNPLDCDANVFESVNKSTCTLYVPAKSVAAYKAANVWRDFTNILPLDDEEEPSPTYYTIRFLNWNGAELQNTQVQEGEMPSYNGAIPTRPEDEQYTYEFKGWSPTIVAAAADANYTAQYIATEKPIKPTIPSASDLTKAGYDIVNNVVVCFQFVDDANICNDIVLAGTYNNWNTNPDNMLKMQTLAGFDGWYVAEFLYTYSTNEKSEPVYPQAKPVQLKDDGSFSWNFQSGDRNAWAYVDGKAAYVVQGLDNEADIYYPEAGAYIYKISYWKQHNTPCVFIPKHNYTIHLYAPNACPDMKPAVVGGFNNWEENIAMTAQTDTQEKTYYTCMIYAEEKTEFKFREVNDYTWKNQLQVYNKTTEGWYNMSNIVLPVVTKDTTIVYDFSDDELYRFGLCSGIEPTGIEQITDDQSEMTNKIIIDNQLFILRGDKVYTITGQEVR